MEFIPSNRGKGGRISILSGYNYQRFGNEKIHAARDPIEMGLGRDDWIDRFETSDSTARARLSFIDRPSFFPWIEIYESERMRKRMIAFPKILKVANGRISLLPCRSLDS